MLRFVIGFFLEHPIITTVFAAYMYDYATKGNKDSKDKEEK